MVFYQSTQFTPDRQSTTVVVIVTLLECFITSHLQLISARHSFTTDRQSTTSLDVISDPREYVTISRFIFCLFVIFGGGISKRRVPYSLRRSNGVSSHSVFDYE